MAAGWCIAGLPKTEAQDEQEAAIAACHDASEGEAIAAAQVMALMTLASELYVAWLMSQPRRATAG